MRKIRYANEFSSGVSKIYSERLLEELDKALSLIESFPDIGSLLVRPSLTERFGKGLRKFPISPFIIVYRYDDDENVLDFIALPHEKTIR